MSKPNFPKPVDIGFALKCAREDRDLSQKKVMEITGINNKTLSGYENNISEPDISTLILLAKTYKMSLDDLLMLNSDFDNTDKNANTQSRLIIKYFNGLPDSVQNDVITQIKSLHKKYCKKSTIENQ